MNKMLVKELQESRDRFTGCFDYRAVILLKTVLHTIQTINQSENGCDGNDVISLSKTAENIVGKECW